MNMTTGLNVQENWSKEIESHNALPDQFICLRAGDSRYSALAFSGGRMSKHLFIEAEITPLGLNYLKELIN